MITIVSSSLKVCGQLSLHSLSLSLVPCINKGRAPCRKPDPLDQLDLTEAARPLANCFDKRHYVVRYTKHATCNITYFSLSVHAAYQSDFSISALRCDNSSKWGKG